MSGDIKLSEEIVRSLRCPVCRSRLERRQADFVCLSDACRKVFPVVDGIPVLINERDSVFSIQDFVQDKETFFGRHSRIERLAERWLPKLGRNLKARTNSREFARQVLALCPRPRVLVVGGSIVGEGLEDLLARPDIEFVETDVSTGPRTALICDAHDIPFCDGTFEGVIAQAVLEHVADPWRCVAEMHRVLKSNGVVYAETAFMFPVHGAQYDFTRFTYVGHRRLFRAFEEVASGAVCGPGMALAYSYQFFLRSLSQRGPVMRRLMYLAAVLTAWPLKYFDYWLVDKPYALDAAAGVYFLGRRRETALSDREVCASYRGRTA